MSKNKNKENKKEVVEKAVHGFYKGYELKWLKKETSHPDHYLVAEYEAVHGPVEEQ